MKLEKIYNKKVISDKTAGVVSLLIAACLVILLGAPGFSAFFQGLSINQLAIIKSTQTQTIKTASIVAGGKPVAWTTLVRRSDIATGKYLLKLPKGAININIQTVSSIQAKQILAQKPKESLTLAQRQQLAKVTITTQKPKGLFTAQASFLFANLEQMASDAVRIMQVITPTPDAMMVDLSDLKPAEIPTPAPSPDEYVKVDYETPAPTIIKQTTDTGKVVTVSAPAETPDQPRLTDVIALTKIPEIFKVGQENKIKIKWKNGPSTSSGHKTDMLFHAYDTDNNGKLDYIEWTVPHLSDQIFEIIFISKAFELDESQNIINDIYDLTQSKDGQWASVPDSHYIRATFGRILNSSNDNTVYAKPTIDGQSATIEVYPVYTDSDGNQIEGPKVATFPAIDHEGTYKVLLTDLRTPTDVFDLKITHSAGSGQAGNVDVDWIVDPTPVDAFWVGGTGSWSQAATHWATTSNGAPDAGNLPGSTTNVYFDSNSGTGTVTADGDVLVASFNHSQTGLTVAMGANALTITTTLLNFGTVTVSSGIMTFPADLSSSYLGNFTFTAANTIPASTISNLYNNLTLSNPAAYIAAGDLYVTSTFTLASGATLNMSNYRLQLVDISNSGTITMGSGVLYPGSGTMGNFTFTESNTIPSITFSTLTLNKSGGTFTASTNLTATNLIITAGTLDMVNGNLMVTGALTNNGTISAGTGLLLLPADTTYGNFTFTATRTVPASLTYDTLTLNGLSAIFTAGGAIAATNLIIISGTLTLNGKELTLSGTFSNSGTLQLNGDEIITGLTNDTTHGTFLYSGTAGPYTLENYTYNNLTINGSGATFNLPATLTINGNLTVTAGILDATASNYNLNVVGNWSNSGAFTARSGTVILSGTSQKVLGATTFYNLTKDISAASADTLLFQQSNTQAISASGALTLKGALGKVLTLRGCDASGNQTSGDPKWGLNVSSTGTTLAVDYVDVKDSDASAGKQIVQTNSTNSGNNLNWEFAPNAPTLVSPANGSATTDDTPILSANYSDPDVGDTGLTNYRISNSSLADCVINTNVVAWTTTAETSTNNEDTTFTPSSSIGSNGTYYWCSQNDDGIETSVWTQMGRFVLDTFTPDIVAVDAGPSSSSRTSLTSGIWFVPPEIGNDDQISFSWTDPASVSGDTFYYELNSTSSDTITGNESNTTNSYIDNITIADGIHYFHVRPKDGAGTFGVERIFTVQYSKTAGGGGGASILPSPVTTPPVVPTPPIVVENQNQIILQQIEQQLNNIGQQVQKLPSPAPVTAEPVTLVPNPKIPGVNPPNNFALPQSIRNTIYIFIKIYLFFFWGIS